MGEVHDEKLVEKHEGKFKTLGEITAQQTEELKKGREVFEKFDNRITSIETSVSQLKDEFIEKKKENGAAQGETQKELKSLREMITETNNNVSYLRGLKDGQSENKKDKQNWKVILIQLVFIGFAAANLAIYVAKDWLHWLS